MSRIPSDGARRDCQPELQEKFIRDPLLDPGRVGLAIVTISRCTRRPGSVAGLAFHRPEKPPALAMPADQRVRLDPRVNTEGAVKQFVRVEMYFVSGSRR